MKKTRKLLSLLTALAIVMSAFVGMAFPASADEGDEAVWAVPEYSAGDAVHSNPDITATDATVTVDGTSHDIKVLGTVSGGIDGASSAVYNSQTGGTVTFTVNAETAGDYDVTVTGRGAAGRRVDLAVGETVYAFATDTEDEYSSYWTVISDASDSRQVFTYTFEGVALAEGQNEIAVGTKVDETWAPDIVGIDVKAVEPAVIPEGISYKNGTVTVNVADVETATLIYAQYNSNTEVLKSVSAYPLTFSEGIATLALADAVNGSKLMVWDTLDGMTPICEAKEVTEGITVTDPTEPPSETGEPDKTAEPTASPTAEPTATPEPTETPKPVATEEPETVDEYYYQDSFDTHDAGAIITADKEAVADVTLTGETGSLVFSVGSRSSGLDYYHYASIVADGENKYMDITSSNYSTSSRGVSFKFSDTINAPTEEGKVLVYKFDVKMDAAAVMTITGIGALKPDTASIGTDTWRTVKIILDTANGRYTVINRDKATGGLVGVSTGTTTATSLSTVTFYEDGGKAGTHAYFDNMSVYSMDNNIYDVTITVTDKNGDAVEAATVAVDTVGTFTTDANGKVAIVLPNGKYEVEASKAGYEHTEGMKDNDSTTITVASEAQEVPLSLTLMTYAKLPETITINAGQAFVAAPKSEDTSSTAAFTAEVLDQYGIPMTVDEEYSLSWEIYPAGTTEADPNVTIDADGVVSVAKAFSAENQVAAYDVKAVVATGDIDNNVTKTLYIGNNDIIYYEDIDWSAGSGIRNASTTFAEAIELPAISSLSFNLAFSALNTSETSQRTWALVTDAGPLVGLQYSTGDTIKAWTGWNGNTAYNQSSDIGNFTNGVELVTNYVAGTKINVTFTIDTDSKNITVSCGNVSSALPYTIEATKLTGMAAGMYRSYADMNVADITIQEPDNDYLAIFGDTDFAKVYSDTAVTRTYTLGQSVIVPDETFDWSVTDSEGNTSANVTINDGELTVTKDAVPGTYTITAASNKNENKTAELEVTIDDFQSDVDVTIEGAWAYDSVDAAADTYAVTKVVDKYGDDITDLIADAVWTSKDTSVAAIDAATGALTILKEGTTEITATIANGTKADNSAATITKTIPVTVATYSVVSDTVGETVDISSLVTADNITGYVVTVADADGNKLAQNTVAKADVSGNTVAVPEYTGTAAKVEVSPVYALSVGTTYALPKDSYDFTIVATGSRSDVYINDQMLVNNMLQYGTVGEDTVHDIYVSEGYAVPCLYENEGISITSITASKSPSIVNRVTKMYVLGDSLVCKYYTGGSAENTGAQTGWGQVLQNYITDDIEVVDLGNSGVKASGLLVTAFTQILGSAQQGDYFVLESGYNDTKETEEIMKTSVTAMVEQAKALGVNVILVSPNASHHDYKESVAWTKYMADVATDTETDYIDLSKLSYDFLYGIYGDDKESVKASYNISDGLHANFNGAHKWASVVAKGLADLGYDIVNADYTYTFTDTLGNEITCQAK